MQVYLTRYAHDRSDAELEMTYPSGRVLRHARDGEGRVTQVLGTVLQLCRDFGPA